VDFSDLGADGWRLLLFLEDITVDSPDSMFIGGCPYKLITWALHKVQDAIKINICESEVSRLIEHCLSSNNTEPMDLLLKFFGPVSANWPNKYSRYGAMHSIPLHLQEMYYSASMRTLMTSGADKHFVSKDLHFSEEDETPMSLAIYTSIAFSRFRKLLIDSGQNLEDFVAEELNAAPLPNRGWNQDTLLALLRYDFQPRCFQLVYCNECGHHGIPRDIWWEKQLERIRGQQSMFSRRSCGRYRIFNEKGATEMRYSMRNIEYKDVNITNVEYQEDLREDGDESDGDEGDGDESDGDESDEDESDGDESDGDESEGQYICHSCLQFMASEDLTSEEQEASDNSIDDCDDCDDSDHNNDEYSEDNESPPPAKRQRLSPCYSSRGLRHTF
jgi:hypothetical protein